MVTTICRNCRNFRLDKSDPPLLTIGAGFCHRHAPVMARNIYVHQNGPPRPIGEQPWTDTISRWPDVSWDDGCGEWEKV